MLSTSSFALIRECTSTKRIERYRHPHDSNEDVVARYLWNTCLCEALYPSLQSLEVALRNSIYAAGAARFNNPNWLQDASIVTGLKQQTALVKVIRELKVAKRPVEPNHIIASTTFGLWTGLLERTYEPRLWPAMLRHSFPYAPSRIRNRRDLYKHLSRIRRLRNRVFHHEPIWNKSTLATDHADILNTIGWINPEMKQIMQHVDRFSTVNTPAYLAYIKAML